MTTNNLKKNDYLKLNFTKQTTSLLFINYFIYIINKYFYISIKINNYNNYIIVINKFLN